jgi:septal ring factor EnvC (AmiA/AmiB activator)
MFDLPPDLPRLRVLEVWHRTWLQRIEQAIEEAEAAAAEEKRAAEQRERQRPPAADWVITRGIDTQRTPIEVHVGGCHMQGKHTKPVTREQAVEAIVGGVIACGHCRPDSALGLEG